MLYTSFPFAMPMKSPSLWRTYYLSSETVSLFLPFLRRAASTFLPLAVDILLRKPCLFALFLSEGWNVLFMISTYIILFFFY